MYRGLLDTAHYGVFSRVWIVQFSKFTSQEQTDSGAHETTARTANGRNFHHHNSSDNFRNNDNNNVYNNHNDYNNNTFKHFF